MNQCVTVAKIAGKASRSVARAFHRWSEARTPCREEPSLVQPSQWPESCRREMKRLADQLREHATQLPIVFYNEHVDMWSMGDVFAMAFPKNGNLLSEVESNDGLSLLCYELPDGNALDEHMRRKLRRHSFWETVSYFRVVQAAASSWEGLIDHAVIVVVRSVLGGSVLDKEVRAAQDVVPDWLDVASVPT